jgi:NADPH-dependent 7-cyano-7-deazaguanine reductase QueF
MSDTESAPLGALETVDAPTGIGITLETDVVARCPVDGGVDRYTVEIKIASEGQSVECQSLQDYLDGFLDVQASQEEVAGAIDDTLAQTLPDAHYRLTVSGEHAGVDTEVRGR